MTKAFGRPDIENLIHDRSNWGRWGDDDELGAVNLITAEKRVAAASLVRTGRSVSMSREFPTDPGPANPRPADHFMKLHPRDQGAGAMVDYIGLEYHGIVATHVDALCHTWDDHGMWNGRKPEDVFTPDGATWGAVDKWKEGLLTRGVLLDVPAFRGEPYVTNERPVTAGELAAIAEKEGVEVGAGDALVVYSGRDAWDAEHPEWGAEPARPGLHGSCLEFLRDRDCPILAWDMQDSFPNEWDLPWTVHASIFAYGVAIVDNCNLAPLSRACAELGRHDFMFILSPLLMTGATGSPANPLALF
jgi:kynurenine formamidase